MSSSAEPSGVLVVVGAYGARGGLQVKMRRLVAGVGSVAPVTVLTWDPSPAEADGAVVASARSVVGFRADPAVWLAPANALVAVVSGVIAALWRRRRWSVALASGLHPEGTVAALACLVLRRRFLVRTWLPGPLGNVARLERSLGAGLLERLLRRAHAFLAETDEMADELVAAGFPRGRIHVLPNATDVEKLSPATPAERASGRRRLGLGDARVLCYCGRFDLRQKRLDLLLAGWELAAPEGWRLLLVGDGPDRETVEALAERLEPPPLIAGWQEDVAPFFAAADASALPTNFEGLSGALIDAMACGLPVLVSRTSGFERMALPGVALVANDPEGWAAAISRLAAQDDAERAVMGALGREWVVRHADRRTQEAVVLRLLGCA